MPRTHITWTTEAEDGKCPECDSATVLIIALSIWKVDSESEAWHRFEDGVAVDEEITGHWCPECRVLRSLSLNT